ncbi:MAG: N-acetylglucosamine-6-phosphate deacetylase [Ignisphaera sp.]|nr:N-acetylglucosamine-6-phosphate deacetylase [Ignisphaera sp.]MDW8084780.1 N-acetylglucosamine-6-phosphate deacetylase [Ignisphaera sp.]
MGCTALINSLIITPYRVVRNGAVVIEGKRVLNVGSADNTVIPNSCERIDVEGKIVAPGFIDIHLHGGGGADTMDATYEALNTISLVHASGGSTAIMPSTVSAPLEDIIRAIDAVRDAMARGVDGARILGVHIEGPFISLEQRGAHDEKFVREPSDDDIDMLVRNVDVVKRVTAAPEVRGCLELGKLLSSRGVLMSIGHSNATIDEVLQAVESGYKHVTHIYSATSMTRRIRAYRYPGVVEAAYLIDDLTVEVISDGKHLPPTLVRLVIKNKGLDKTCIVTDAMRAAGLPPGKYKLGSVEAVVDEGVAWLPDRTAFAGSIAKMNSMLRFLVEEVGITLQDAVRLATVNPAKILGIDGCKGLLAPGKDADIVVMNRDFEILLTIVEGKTVYKSKEWYY